MIDKSTRLRFHSQSFLNNVTAEVNRPPSAVQTLQSSGIPLAAVLAQRPQFINSGQASTSTIYTQYLLYIPKPPPTMYKLWPGKCIELVCIVYCISPGQISPISRLCQCSLCCLRNQLILKLGCLSCWRGKALYQGYSGDWTN